MSDISKLTTLITSLQTTVSDLTEKYAAANESILSLKTDNIKLRSDVEQLKSVVNRQATAIANLDTEIDDLNQYGRRENIVFTNLQVATDESPETQVINLCKEIGVDVDKSDIVACHPLPSGNGKPRRIITRFHERAKAQKVFNNRRKAKDIPPAAKVKIAADKGKGFGILPNLTIKRGKFFAQVKTFNDTKKHQGCWVDPNTGKILLKVTGSLRGRVVRTTADLVEIDSSFVPSEWFFCSAPSFDFHNDSSSPTTLGNLSVDQGFSPLAPSRYQMNSPSSSRSRGSRRGSHVPGNRVSSSNRGAWVDSL